MVWGYKMTIKESNEQINKRLDDIIDHFKRFEDKYEKNQKIQLEINNKVIENSTKINGIWKIPAVIGIVVTLISGIAITITIIGG